MSEHFQEDLANFIALRVEENKESGDFKFINQRSSHLLFVYDDLKSGLNYNKKQMVDAGGEFICKGYTVDPNLVMLVYNNRYPIIFSKHIGMPWHTSRIQGEVWVVPTKLITDQDYFNGEGMRRGTTAIVTGGDPSTTFQNPNDKLVVLNGVFYYHGIYSAWKEDVTDQSLTQGTLYQRNDQTFFYYMWTGSEDYKKKQAQKSKKAA